jgi:ribosomal protein L11 methyltransferase
MWNGCFAWLCGFSLGHALVLPVRQRHGGMSARSNVQSTAGPSFLPLTARHIHAPWCATTTRCTSSSSIDSGIDVALENNDSMDNDDNEDTPVHHNTDTTDPAALRSVTFFHVSRDDQPDILCEFLMELGALSTCITDAHVGTKYEEARFGEPGMPRDVWTTCHVTAHVPASTDVAWMLQTVGDIFPQFSTAVSAVTTVPNRDWVVHVQQGWKPIVIGRHFCLQFPWHTAENVQEAWEMQGDVSVEPKFHLQLQGGVAFGTGEHPTTQLCLEWLMNVLPWQPSNTTTTDTRITTDITDTNTPIYVMDYGSGSGILGMAAGCLLPDRVQAVGVDIDLDACRIANTNARINRIPMRNYLPPLFHTTNHDCVNDNSSNSNDESMSLLLKAYHRQQQQRQQEEEVIVGSRNDTADQDWIDVLPETLQGPRYHVVVANILAGPLQTLAPVLYSLTRPGGVVGLSGILPHQGDAVVVAYQQAGYVDVSVQRELNGWLLVTGRKIA